MKKNVKTSVLLAMIALTAALSGCWCEVLHGSENDGSGFDPYYRELYKTYYGEECRYL